MRRLAHGLRKVGAGRGGWRVVCVGPGAWELGVAGMGPRMGTLRYRHAGGFRWRRVLVGVVLF